VIRSRAAPRVDFSVDRRPLTGRRDTSTGGVLSRGDGGPETCLGVNGAAAGYQ